jgi:hypothetical protein
VIAFSQPFGLSEQTGGARILRGLVQPSPESVVSFATCLRPSPPTDVLEERWLARRPQLGRLETTRFAHYFGYLDLALDRYFQHRLRAELKIRGASAVHCIAQNHDFWSVLEVARDLDLPYVLTIHDDLRHSLEQRPELPRTLRQFGRAWQLAKARTVISEAMGQEYCRLYGDRPYEVITDGVAEVRSQPRSPGDGSRVYFMGGGAHWYQKNFEPLFEILNRRSKSMIFRGTWIAPQPSERHVERRPWVSEAEVERDFEGVDLCYLPLPFGREFWTRFSLSTKLVTYLGSGRPILYHGPADSAVALLLEKHGAGVIVDSLDPNAVAAGLDEVVRRGPELAAAALELARKRFRLADQRTRFWRLFGVPA